VKTLSDVNGDQRINLSISVGVTDTDGTEPLDFIIKRADDALYKAKYLRRDGVEGTAL
jgi:PleD family two-component response regulator